MRDLNLVFSALNRAISELSAVFSASMIALLLSQSNNSDLICCSRSRARSSNCASISVAVVSADIRAIDTSASSFERSLLARSSRKAICPASVEAEPKPAVMRSLMDKGSAKIERSYDVGSRRKRLSGCAQFQGRNHLLQIGNDLARHG